MDRLTPKDHAEAVAIFRSEIVGALTRRDLERGELCAALRDLSKKRFRPPDAKATRTYSEITLQRWYYRLKKGGLAALRPRDRSDRGRAREITPEQKKLLCDIRREHQSASVSLILRTLVADGRLEERAVSAATVRRLFRELGLDRIPLRDGAGAKTRLRWQAARPGALWHGDVCHTRVVDAGGKTCPVRVHALLDDASRYVVAIEALAQEREIDMLGVLVRALRRHGPPDALFLDNGSTYRGDVLRVACGRLGISLLHAKPYDPEARGKMERWWRTLREGCLDFLGDSVASLHDVNVRIWAFLDQHYHVAPHASLFGRSPGTVFVEAVRPVDDLDEAKLRDALTVRARRRVRRDSTLSVEGLDFEIDAGFLAGRIVTVGYCLVDDPPAPWVEHGKKHLALRLVDPVKNARRKRPPRSPSAPSAPVAPVPFDPAGALLDRAVGRTPNPNARKENDR